MAVYLIHANSATRSDPLRAQRLTLEALLPLAATLREAPGPVRRGYAGCLRRARLDLAYASLRAGLRRQAIAAVLPALVHVPSARSLRDVASIVRGLIQPGTGGSSTKGKS
jgi:hypothetical protein